MCSFGGDSLEKQNRYREEWDLYSSVWEDANGQRIDCRHLGDEWGAGHRERYQRFFLPHIPNHSRVLEIGPGGGRMTEELLSNLSHLTCLDVAPRMLDRIRQRFGERPDLELVEGDGKSLRPLPDGSMDSVVSYDVFVHLEPEDIYAYLIEIRRVLRSGGTGMLNFANLLSTKGFEKFLSEYRNFLGGHRSLGKFSRMCVPIMDAFMRSLDLTVLLFDEENFVGGRDAFVAFQKPH